MKVLTASIAAFALAVVVVAPAQAQEQSRFGVNVTEWDSSTPLNVAGGILPIGGAGQINGEFVTGERYGVQIGVRASERFVGPTLLVTRSKHTGVYTAAVGYSTGDDATWNYDLHVDLRGAQGVAAGKTLGDYTLVLDSDARPDFFGCVFPCDLGALLPNHVVLFQTSQNLGFGNTGVGVPFDATAADSYSFTLTLTPKTFNGPPITARMRVDVQ